MNLQINNAIISIYFFKCKFTVSTFKYTLNTE